MIKKALLYKTFSDKTVECCLCAHRCVIGSGGSGKCGVRINTSGTLYTTTYSEVIQASVERLTINLSSSSLPLTRTYCIASIGCNFVCGFCKNWQVAHLQKHGTAPRMGYEIAPHDVVRNAVGLDCQSISFGYTEPTVFFEYAYDVARIAKKTGLSVIFNTNGYLTAEAIDIIGPFLDTVRIDVKSSRSEFYQSVCGAELQPVVDTIKRCKQHHLFTEVSTPLIPGVNDSVEEIEKIAACIADIDRDIPWYITPFVPEHKYSEYNKTSVETLTRANSIARSFGLNTVSSWAMPSSAAAEDRFEEHSGAFI
ncbi:MAG: radical SAM protein [Endomicrobiales bacterium]|jgi:pyruvate formate lyase activating enzyme